MNKDSAFFLQNLDDLCLLFAEHFASGSTTPALEHPQYKSWKTGLKLASDHQRHYMLLRVSERMIGQWPNPDAICSWMDFLWDTTPKKSRASRENIALLVIGSTSVEYFTKEHLASSTHAASKGVLRVDFIAQLMKEASRRKPSDVSNKNLIDLLDGFINSFTLSPPPYPMAKKLLHPQDIFYECAIGLFYGDFTSCHPDRYASLLIDMLDYAKTKGIDLEGPGCPPVAARASKLIRLVTACRSDPNSRLEILIKNDAWRQSVFKKVYETFPQTVLQIVPYALAALTQSASGMSISGKTAPPYAYVFAGLDEAGVLDDKKCLASEKSRLNTTHGRDVCIRALNEAGSAAPDALLFRQAQVKREEILTEIGHANLHLDVAPSSIKVGRKI